LGSSRYCRVNYLFILFLFRPSHAVSPYDCISQGATGFGTQLVLKYLYNFAFDGSDVKPEDVSNEKEIKIPEIIPITPKAPENIFEHIVKGI